MTNHPQANQGIDIDVTVVTPLRQNCMLIKNLEDRCAILLDPGGDEDQISEMIDTSNLPVEAIWLTHGHVDHICAVDSLSTKYSIPIIGPHQDDQIFIDQVERIAQEYGIDGAKRFSPTRWLSDGDTLKLGRFDVRVAHCPGHSPGSVVYLFTHLKLAFVGDVLFHGSIGRTDLHMSNHHDLIDSIKQKLWPLGDYRFFCGHGPASTFAYERLHNPFVADHVLS